MTNEIQEVVKCGLSFHQQQYMCMDHLQSVYDELEDLLYINELGGGDENYSNWLRTQMNLVLDTIKSRKKELGL